MTTYEQRITAIREAIAIQVAVLGGLARDLSEDGHDGIAGEVLEIVQLLEEEPGPKADGDPDERNEALVDRIDEAIKNMKDLGNRLHSLGFRYAVMALDGARRVLTDRRNRLIADTQPIDPKDVEAIAKKDRKE
jgi:hypothetical protein